MQFCFITLYSLIVFMTSFLPVRILQISLEVVPCSFSPVIRTFRMYLPRPVGLGASPFQMDFGRSHTSQECFWPVSSKPTSDTCTITAQECSPGNPIFLMYQMKILQDTVEDLGRVILDTLTPPAFLFWKMSKSRSDLRRLINYLFYAIFL